LWQILESGHSGVTCLRKRLHLWRSMTCASVDVDMASRAAMTALLR